MKRLAAKLVAVLVLVPLGAADAQTVDASMFKALPFRSIGPAVMGGRIDDLAVVEHNPSTIYLGTASGGVWKTVNRGVTWQAVFDHEAVSSIGDVTVAPSNPDIVWVGTGEPNNRQSSSFGNGVYRSDDGGRTWTHAGLSDTHHIGRIVADPEDPDIAYVAALGHLWGPNRERGLFKTTDGGRTWSNTKFINEDTGFVDVAMDPVNRKVLYAAAYQRRRTAWGFNGGGPYSALYKTVDGAATWKKLSGGLPEGILGRIGLAVARSAPGTVYAIVEHRPDGGIYRSDDWGETWRKVNNLNPRPMYYSQIIVDPKDANRLYVLGSTFYLSQDGGRTFADPVSARPGPNASMSPMYDVGVHGDHHALWIDPADSRFLILGNDGGLYFSYDGSATWDKVNNLPLAQIYALGADMKLPYTICIGLQDTHSWCGPSASRRPFGIMNSDWQQIDFGDGMYAQPDPSDASTVYIEASNGSITRINTVTGDRKPIKPHPRAGEPEYRFNWMPPIQISPHDSKTIYFGGNRFFKSTDRGETWTASEDLTKAQNRDKLPIMGVLPSADMLSRHDGVAAWGTITTLAESPVVPGVIWAGTDDGNVQISRDGGRTWTPVADGIPGVPGDAWVSRVEPSHQEAGRAYVSLDRHWWDDFGPYLYVTEDYGKTWKSLSDGLTGSGWINVVREHPNNPGLLLAGTETGLFASFDRGASWVRMRENLPTVPVDDLFIHPRENDLVVGTHGRSVYVLDDITPLEGLTEEVLASESHLFQPRPATAHLMWKSESYSAQREFAGANPPFGAIVNYYLKSEASAGVKLSILDARDRTLRELNASGNAGLNRVVWDLRVESPAGVSEGRGPFVLPGRYTVRLAAFGRETRRTLEVKHDPLMPVSDADRSARFAFLSELNALQAKAQEVAGASGTLETRVKELVEQIRNASESKAAITAAAEAVSRKLGEIRRRLGARAAGDGGGEEVGFGRGGLVGRINSLFTELDGAQPRGPQQGTLTGPTAVQRQRLEEASGQVAEIVKEFNELLSGAIADLNQEIDRANVPAIPTRGPIRPIG